jgi:CelD/BcsL family acetyltransferase involved in cellulose biosynthesis
VTPATADRLPLREPPAIEGAGAPDELMALQEDWDDLLSRCPDHHFSQTFDWAVTGWKRVGKPRGRGLEVLTLRDADRLVGLWPLVTYRQGGIRIVRPLGAEASEYTLPLLDPGNDPIACARRLLEQAGLLGDLLLLPYVPGDSALSHQLHRAGLWRATDFPAPAFRIYRRDYPDWTHYRNALGAKDRRELNRCRRRLAEAGAIEIGIAGAAESPTLVSWILERKQLWLDDQGLASAWIGKSDYGDFLADLASATADRAHGVRLFSLKVGGTVIAATLATVDGARVEALINVYDREWRGFAPGQLLMEHCIAWAFEQGLDFDLRIGDAAYKRNWASRPYPTSTWYVATGLRGLGVVLERRCAVAYGTLRTRLANLRKAARRLPDGRRRP